MKLQDLTVQSFVTKMDNSGQNIVQGGALRTGWVCGGGAPIDAPTDGACTFHHCSLQDCTEGC